MHTKTSLPTGLQNYKTIYKYFLEIDFNAIAVRTGFKKRAERKISGSGMLFSFLDMFSKGTGSYHSWALGIGFNIKSTLSRQAVWKRVCCDFTAFVKSVLEEVFILQLKDKTFTIPPSKSLGKFKRLLVQDSTILHLPDCMSIYYPGNYSRGIIKSLIKIQLVIDLFSHKAVCFSITPYSKNDQSVSKDILDVAQKGDLVVRDLGYFSLAIFEQMLKQEIAFVSRLKPRVNVLELGSGTPIELVKLLGNKKVVDRVLLVGSKQKIKLRLIAVKLADEIVNERIRKEKKNRDKRLNHSEAYYKLMQYQIFITSEEAQTLDIAAVRTIYRLRWRIENIFKAWKSNFNLQKALITEARTKKERVESVIYMALIFIILFQLKLYNLLMKYAINRQNTPSISLSKLSKIISEKFDFIWQCDDPQFINRLSYFCSYDKRKDRKNFLLQIGLS